MSVLRMHSALEWSLPPNALEFSCGDTFHYSTNLLGRAVSYNSALGSA